MTTANIQASVLLTGSGYGAWSPTNGSYLTYGFYESASDLPGWYAGKEVGVESTSGGYPRYTDAGMFIPFDNSPGGERDFVNSTFESFLERYINISFVPISDAAASEVFDC